VGEESIFAFKEFDDSLNGDAFASLQVLSLEPRAVGCGIDCGIVGYSLKYHR
jgi:hypothetical protein